MEHLSLVELNELVKQALSAQLQPAYWVVAEIGELRVAQNGHCYLDLVEKGDNRLLAKMRATIWSYTFRNLQGWFESVTGEALRPGLKILAQVEVKFHELYGLSFNVKDIDAQYTLGERARRRREVIQQLIDEGVYEMNKALPLPVVPQRVAVISSPTAAGLGDFMDQLRHNRGGYRFEVQLFKASMQGDAAEASIVAALLEVYDCLERQGPCFDVVVVIRGGGAQVDLDCFDTYGLATHIAQFPLPVITGIGHERDETVADLVAHTKMKTPTAVAEFLIDGLTAYDERMEGYRQRLERQTTHRLREQTYRLDGLQTTLRYALSSQLQQQNQHFTQRGEQLQYLTQARLRRERERLARWPEVLRTQTHHQLQRWQQQLNTQEKVVALLDPASILRRGFTQTYVNGKLLTKTGKIAAGSELRTLTANETLISTLKEQQPRNDGQKKD
ncbi:MAG: exodeoxyribonuclease VII large subunit [Tunicatimonas sp.]